MKRHYDHSISIKGNHLIEKVAYSFRGSIYYHHVTEQGSAQLDTVLEKELLHADMQVTGSRLSHLSIGDFKAYPHSDILSTA